MYLLDPGKRKEAKDIPILFSHLLPKAMSVQSLFKIQCSGLYKEGSGELRKSLRINFLPSGLTVR